MSGELRTLRFELPYADVPDAALGLRVAPSGRLATIEGPAAIRQALQLLLSTVPGERVMRPDYGCELQRLVFSPNDDTTAGLAIHYVRQAVERFEPRVEIVALDAERDPERAGVLYVMLRYRIRATGAQDELAMGVDLMGASG